MLIKKLDFCQELFVYLLMFSITFSNAFVETSVGFIIFIYFMRRIILKDFVIPKTVLNSLIFLYFFIILVSFARSSFPNESFKGLLRVIKFSLLYFSLTEFFIADKKRIKRALLAIVLVAAFTFFNGLFQDIFGFDLLRHKVIDKLDYLHRVNASFVHSNDFGAYLIAVLPLCICFFITVSSKKAKAFFLALCALGFYCLVRTSSRGAWLGFLFGIIVFFFYYKKRVAIVVPLCIIALFLVSPHGIERVLNIFKLGGDTGWERLQLWKGTWSMIKEHPVLGFGINTFSDYFPYYKPVEYFDSRYSHNSYLQMWAEIGALGLLSFLLIVFKIFKVTFSGLSAKLKEPSQGIFVLGLGASYIAFLIQSGLDTNLYSLVLCTLFWVINSLLVSLCCNP